MNTRELGFVEIVAFDAVVVTAAEECYLKDSMAVDSAVVAHCLPMATLVSAFPMMI